MNPIDIHYQGFDSQVIMLQSTFVDTLSTTTLRPSPQDEELMKAFIIRFHASLEDYFERIATLLIARYLERYRNKDFVVANDLTDISNLNLKVKSQIETFLMIVCYATFKGSKGKITTDFDALYQSLEKLSHENELTSANISKIKTTERYVDEILVQSNNILKFHFEKANHGVALPNLSQILTSVGIDVSTDLRLLNSLRLIAYHRGDYAHLGQSTKMTRVMSKADILNCIADCRTICEQVKNIAREKYN